LRSWSPGRGLRPTSLPRWAEMEDESYNEPCYDNPPPDPSKKWSSDSGIKAMQKVLTASLDEIRDAWNALPQGSLKSRVQNDQAAYDLYLRTFRGGADDGRGPGMSGKRFISWVQRSCPHEVPIFSMTLGQMFEAAIVARGMHPFKSTRTQTFWTGNWSPHVEEERHYKRDHQPYEGYAILTRPMGWSVVYMEDREQGLTSGGAYTSGGRIRGGRMAEPGKGGGRMAEPGKGILVRTVSSTIYSDNPTLHVYPQNMGVLRTPGHSYRGDLDAYSSTFRDYSYNEAVQDILHKADSVADFMNNVDFHGLELLKRFIRRQDDIREEFEVESTGQHKFTYTKRVPQLPSGLKDTIFEAAILSDRLGLGQRAIDLYKIAVSGRWDGEGWEEGAKLPPHGPMVLPPDDPFHRLNLYHALKVGPYPPEWLGPGARPRIDDED